MYGNDRAQLVDDTEVKDSVRNLLPTHDYLHDRQQLMGN